MASPQSSSHNPLILSSLPLTSQFSILRSRVFVLEEDGEKNGNYQGVAGEDEPHGRPAASAFNADEEASLVPCTEFVHDGLCAQGTDSGTETVGHHHEQSLCRRADARVGFLVHKQRAGDVVKVKGKAIYNHGEDDGPYHAAGVADAEKSETEEPGNHGHQHHLLDAEALEEEGNEQNAEGFCNL